MTGRHRLRILGLVQAGVLRPADVTPPLSLAEMAWIKAGPTTLLAEALAGEGDDGR